MAKWIKNDDIVNHTWVGQLITVGAYYEIQLVEEISWLNNAQLLTDIGSGLAVVAKDDSGNNDITDVSMGINYLKDLINEYDTDGRQIQRVAAAKKGWAYLAHVIEFESSKLASVFSSDYTDTDRADYSIKFYDNQDVELVAGTQAELDNDCVKTIVNISPDYDYELVGGNIRQETNPGADVRLWVVGGAPELGAAGTKEFIGGVNMCFLTTQEHIDTDGRASKYMKKTTTGVPYQTNQLEFIVRHPVGKNHKLMIVMEYFRA